MKGVAADIPVYVISLPAAVERRKSMADQLSAAGLTFEFFDAIRGDALSVDERGAVVADKEIVRANMKGRDLNNGEIGCALSHQSVYQKILASGAERALVLEDDALLLPGFMDVLAASHEIRDIDILILGYPKLPSDEVRMAWLYEPIMALGRLSSGHRYGLRPKQAQKGTVAYIISRSACEKMKINFPVATVADDYPLFEKRAGVRVWHLRPFVVMEDTRHLSTIRGDLRRNRGGLSIRQHFSRSLRGIIRHIQVLIMGMRNKHRG